MEHALPRRTWSLCMTSENHGTVGPAGCKFSHAPEKHERVLVPIMEARLRLDRIKKATDQAIAGMHEVMREMAVKP